MPPKIRIATAADAPAMLEIYAPIVRETAGPTRPASPGTNRCTSGPSASTAPSATKTANGSGKSNPQPPPPHTALAAGPQWAAALANGEALLKE